MELTATLRIKLTAIGTHSEATRRIKDTARSPHLDLACLGIGYFPPPFFYLFFLSQGTAVVLFILPQYNFYAPPLVGVVFLTTWVTIFDPVSGGAPGFNIYHNHFRNLCLMSLRVLDMC